MKYLLMILVIWQLINITFIHMEGLTLDHMLIFVAGIGGAILNKLDRIENK